MWRPSSIFPPGSEVLDPHSPHHCKWVTVTALSVPVWGGGGGAPGGMTEGREYAMGKTFLAKRRREARWKILESVNRADRS